VLVRVGQEVQEVPRRIGVAVLGFWHVHAADYAQLAHAHPATQIVAVWDDDEERGRAGAREFGVEYAGDLDALLARADVDAVTVTTATSEHHDVMVRAAEAGKHIFTEKLLAPTEAEGEEIVTAADAAGVSLVVSLPRLYHGYTRAIDDVLEGGALGRITYGRVRLSHDGAVAGWLPDRFFDPGPAIGGALTDLGCHPVYLIQRFLGPDPDTVSATYRSFMGRGVEDHAAVTVGYANGRIGVIEAGFVNPGGFSIELQGTEGSLVYSDAVLRVSGHAVPVPDDGEDAFGQWVGHMRAGSRADDNLARAAELTRLVVAANEAAATGRTLAYP
jgi:1,5-anhydro-D-fructose reductase (1,5-anhydro-D-mannitol-forming)